MVLVSFGALAISMVANAIFCCIVTIDYLPTGETFLDKHFSLVGELVVELKKPTLPRVATQHPRDPIPA